MELTKEYFDKKLEANNKNLVTKEYFEEHLDKKLRENNKNLVTKKDLEENNKNLVTKKYFEEKVKNFVTKEYFDYKSQEFLTFRQFGAQIGIQSLAFNEKLDKMAKEINQNINDSQEELAQMVGHGFVDVLTRLDVSKRVAKLEEVVGINNEQTTF